MTATPVCRTVPARYAERCLGMMGFYKYRTIERLPFKIIWAAAKNKASTTSVCPHSGLGWRLSRLACAARRLT
ncbi:MAG: hypothetical protein WBQ49_03260, partial [Rhodomicrobium sp.]